MCTATLRWVFVICHPKRPNEEPVLGEAQRHGGGSLCLLVHSPARSRLPPGGWPGPWSPRRPALWVPPAKPAGLGNSATRSPHRSARSWTHIPQRLDLGFQILIVSSCLHFVWTFRSLAIRVNTKGPFSSCVSRELDAGPLSDM